MMPTCSLCVCTIDNEIRQLHCAPDLRAQRGFWQAVYAAMNAGPDKEVRVGGQRIIQWSHSHWRTYLSWFIF